MSHGKLRADKTCLNCGHHVEERFCPHCGQENIETRQPFYFLFTHFIEDFTHYDGQFWGTLKNLFFKPGKLTNTYLEGKRQRFVPPVKLYIFVSFITFFLPSLLPSGDRKESSTSQELTKENKEEAIDKIIILEKTGLLSKESSEKAIEKIQKDDEENALNKDKEDNISIGFGSKTLKEYDEDQSFFNRLFRPFAVKFFDLKEQGFTQQQIQEKFSEAFIHTLPKALFIYLPVFAFILWLFHNKKKWWYFDHGIFTLHYFSFLLISILAVTVFVSIFDRFDNFFINTLEVLAVIAAVIYSAIYFFIAHHRIYETQKRITLLKGFLIFCTNSFCMLILLLGLLGLSFLMIH